MSRKRLTWKRQDREKGLAGVVQGELGWDLNLGGINVGYVRRKSVGFHEYGGYFWVARCDNPPIPLHNTSSTPVPTVDDAKEACIAYVRQHLEGGDSNR